MGHLEYKNLNFNLDTNSCSVEAVQSRVMTGICSTWSEDLCGDVIHPGAFEKSIEARFTDSKRKRGYGRIRFMRQHRDVIGTVKAIKETEKGLYCENYFSKTTLGNDQLILVQDRAIDQLSIGFIVTDCYFDGEGPWNEGKGRRHILEMDIQEISLVDFPMNEETEVFEVRSRDGKEGNPVKNQNFRSIPGKGIKEANLVIKFELKELAYRIEQLQTEIKGGATFTKAEAKKLAGVVSQIMDMYANSFPEVKEMSVCEECGEEPCVCDSEEDKGCGGGGAKKPEDEEKKEAIEAEVDQKAACINDETVYPENHPIDRKNPNHPETSPEPFGDGEGAGKAEESEGSPSVDEQVATSTTSEDEVPFLNLIDQISLLLATVQK